MEKDNNKSISIQTYMELLQGAKNKKQHKIIKDFITDFNFTTLPLTQNIGHRALIYVQEYALSYNLWAADALIAATAIENNLPLYSSNAEHFGCIENLDLNVFKP
ncbi:Death on curing protein, Doc toxin [uncultured Candidatus Thioglobus sp.]|nr:Death on curing protein, Doc toxin [uncultured Candidatus Thioglobus sp.]